MNFCGLCDRKSRTAASTPRCIRQFIECLSDFIDRNPRYCHRRVLHHLMLTDVSVLCDEDEGLQQLLGFTQVLVDQLYFHDTTPFMSPPTWR